MIFDRLTELLLESFLSNQHDVSKSSLMDELLEIIVPKFSYEYEWRRKSLPNGKYCLLFMYL